MAKRIWTTAMSTNLLLIPASSLLIIDFPPVNFELCCMAYPALSLCFLSVASLSIYIYLITAKMPQKITISKWLFVGALVAVGFTM